MQVDESSASAVIDVPWKACVTVLNAAIRMCDS
jgi:hypothetical protein